MKCFCSPCDLPSLLAVVDSDEEWFGPTRRVLLFKIGNRLNINSFFSFFLWDLTEEVFLLQQTITDWGEKGMRLSCV